VPAPRKVGVLALGGTIAMASDASEASGGLRPALDAEALLRAVPGLAAVAEVRAVTVASLPSASLGFEQIGHVRDVAAELVTSSKADGVVITQGTDTLEETAFLLGLWWAHDAPLVITGAMRGAAALGADGPANLFDAVALAVDVGARGRGVMVTLAGEIHAARHVRKLHSTNLGAFRSPNLGPIGVMREGRPLFLATLPARSAVPLPVGDRKPRVAVIESMLDDDGDLLCLAAKSGYDGIVLSATGVGHVSAAVAAAVSEITPRIPVVLASRTEAGGSLTRTYGFVGSEMDLLSRGVIGAGILDHRKSRLLLWALLAAGQSRDQISAAFEARGAG
jgi:L-asparaginase